MTDRGQIDTARFIAATGRQPETDDLERCNCEKAGQIGHWFCGWDSDRDLPVFVTGVRKSPVS
jgi:hypothetical protein